MAMIESWFKQDLNSPVQVKTIKGNVFSQDSQANLIGVEVFDNGSAATLTGMVSGYVIRQDGGTIAIEEGTLEGNKCSIVLPATAYAVPGSINIAIKLTDDEVVTTLLNVTGTVYRTSTDSVVYPGELIPSVETLIEELEQTVTSMQAAADDIEEQKDTMIASIAAIAEMGTDTTLTQSGVAADAKATGDELSDLKSALPSISFTSGTYTAITDKDYNTLTTPGTYACLSSAAAATMTNCPTAFAHRLYVIATTATNRIYQIILVNSDQCECYRRYCQGTTWYGWKKEAYMENINNIFPSIANESYTNLSTAKDYDTLTTPGTYVVGSSAIAQLMTHCPTESAHRMYVISTTATNRLYQIVIANTVTPSVHMRFYQGTWYNWKQIATTADVNAIKSIFPSIADDSYSVISNGTNYDTLLTPGTYAVLSAGNAKTMTNCPTEWAHRMYVISTTSSARLYQLVLVNSDGAEWYKRYYNGTKWFAWEQEVTEFSLASSTPDGIRMITGVDRSVNIPYTALHDVSVNILHGNTYKGVPYGNREHVSNDALFNFSLNAVYSMFNNPESLMYTETVLNADNERIPWAGSVCSSAVAWITGQPIVFTTYDILNMLNYKTIEDLTDLEIGDVLICHTSLGSTMNHAAVVSNIYSNKSGISAVEIYEEFGTGARKELFTPESVWGLFNGTTRAGDYYKVGRFPVTKIRTVTPVVVNTDIISERGDNIWYAYGDDIYIQSLQNSFSVKSPSGVTSVVDFTSLPVKTGGTMRNIASVLNEVGKWTLYGSNSEESHLTIIKMGSATLSNGVVTLSGYEGCTPVGFFVVEIYSGSNGLYPTHVEQTGYAANRFIVYSKDDLKYAGKINADSFELDLSALTSHTKAIYARIFYDTGCGQAWQDTNVQWI